jgi:hypothetical protein
MAIDERCGSSVYRKICPVWNEEDIRASIKALQEASYKLRKFSARMERTSILSDETLRIRWY